MLHLICQNPHACAYNHAMPGISTLRTIGTLLNGLLVDRSFITARAGDVGDPAPREPSRVRSAILVDAENVASGLGTINRRAAEIFRDQPSNWFDWLTQQPYPGTHEPVRRDILTRTCFLNPVGEKGMRRTFVQAGFQVVDCPPLAANGKNSADIHLVITAMDLLMSPVHYDEVIILASDSDYIPLLRRLRADDRRTMVVAGGPTSASLARSCDHLIDGVGFIRALLAIDDDVSATDNGSAGVNTGVGEVAAQPTTTATSKAATKKTSKATAAETATKKVAAQKTTTKAAATKKTTTATKKAATQKTATKATPAKKTTPAKAPAKKTSSPAAATAKKATSVKSATNGSAAKILKPSTPAEQRERDEFIRVILDAVRQSPEPVRLAAIGTRLAAVRAEAGLAPKLGGRLAALVKQLEPELQGIKFSGVDQGYLFEVNRHQPPGRSRTQGSDQTAKKASP